LGVVKPALAVPLVPGFFQYFFGPLDPKFFILYHVRVVPHWHVANAVGAALARTTCEVVLFADTEQQFATAVGENFSQKVNKYFSKKDAVKLALDRLEASWIETTWSDSLSSSQGDIPSVVLQNQEGMIIERRQQLVEASQESIFNSFTSLGGDQGWLYMNWAWRIRGFIDRLVGGVGLRRGRRHPSELRVGDSLDFWRVEAVKEPQLLRLRAEMKVPGRAWLQYEVQPQDEQHSILVQSAYFAPKGLFGLLYWYLLYPIHSLIFSGLIREIARRATHPKIKYGMHTKAV